MNRGFPAARDQATPEQTATTIETQTMQKQTLTSPVATSS